MATLPANIIYGVVTGRLVTPGPDTDGDTIPEAVPLEGRIVLTPSVKFITDASGTPGSGTTIPLSSQSVELDENGSFAVKLVATNYGNPQGWTWTVSFDLISNANVELRPFSIAVPGNVITDLAHAQPIQDSAGVHVLAAVGMPPGGTTGQAVIKLSNADYHFGFGTGGGGGPTTLLVESITDATTVGKAVMKAASTAAARTAIGAGTSSLALGTTATTAKAGNWVPAAVDISDAGAAGRTVLLAATNAEIRTIVGVTTVDEISGAQTPGKDLLKATTQALARAAIGAGTGTSNLVIGTTATTAKAGSWFPAWNDVTSKPTFHAVATSGDYNALANKPTTVIEHTHDDLEARIEALEARPRIYYVENETSAIPAEARPQDYVVYRSTTAAPAITTFRQWRGAGIGAGSPLAVGTAGTDDDGFDAVVSGASVLVPTSPLREIYNVDSTTAVTWRWTGLTLQDFSFDFGFRPTTAPTATGAFLLIGGVLSLNISVGGIISLINSAGTFMTGSSAITFNSGIYRIKGWRAGTTAGTTTNIKIYDPAGNVFWEPTPRDVGVAQATTFIMGRTGTAGGTQYWSNIRLHNVGTELTA